MRKADLSIDVSEGMRHVVPMQLTTLLGPKLRRMIAHTLHQTSP